MKKRTLASFDQVAEVNTNVNVNTNEELNKILQEKEKSVLVGVYLDPDIAEMLDRLAAGKRGAKSKIVNAALRNFLKEE